MTTDLFAYGTLMFEDILQLVTGCSLHGVRAVLRDYQRFLVRGEVYPAIVPRRGEMVVGVTYSKLPDAAWKRLDVFEGEMYRCTSVSIEREDGGISQAQTYVVKPGFAGRLTTTPWNPEDFEAGDKARFESQYRGFRALSAGGSRDSRA
jgi:gamma-glutamylcyclotransferase (GGCT)/AIG2-like uncharacterized protein YtfP